VAEIKRVFVREEYRGRGISKQLMAHIEKKAAEKGYTALILETGAPLKAAMSLYMELGYQIMDNYGPYKGMVHSVCMRKEL
jgi:GNAT superfamily N-acetyltransferase